MEEAVEETVYDAMITHISTGITATPSTASIKTELTNCLSSSGACACKGRFSYCGVVAAKTRDRFLNITSVGTTNRGKIGRVWFCVDGRKQARRRCRDDAACQSEKGQEEGGCKGDHDGGLVCLVACRLAWVLGDGEY